MYYIAPQFPIARLRLVADGCNVYYSVCAQFTGAIQYHPITTTFPSSLFWGVNVTASYGSIPVINQSSAGIVDTGTTRESSFLFFLIFIYLPATVILLANEFFDIYQAAIPGSFVDINDTGLFVIPAEQVPLLEPFQFKLDGEVYALDAAAQLIPEDQNTIWGGVPGVQYGYFGPMGSLSNGKLDFIIGQKFMERFYAVCIFSGGKCGYLYVYLMFFLSRFLIRRISVSGLRLRMSHSSPSYLPR